MEIIKSYFCSIKDGLSNSEYINNIEECIYKECPSVEKDDISEKMKHFLNYIAGKAPDDEFTKKLDMAVIQARNKEEWRLEYMTLLMRDQENIEKGRAEGILSALLALAKDGIISVTEAAKRANLTEAELKKLM